MCGWAGIYKKAFEWAGMYQKNSIAWTFRVSVIYRAGEVDAEPLTQIRVSDADPSP
jgi:hypothetical protein